MSGKRKTLPREIQELLKRGDLEELKRQFSRCEPNALHINRFGSNIFSLSPLPREFAFWAREQGADVNFKDHYGRFPLFMQASAQKGDVPLLIELGADVHAADAYGTTPLHLASIYGQTQAVQALLDAGADANARARELGRSLTPLEMTLSQDRLPYKLLLEICMLLLNHGAEITDSAGKFLLKSAEHFQRVKQGINDPEFLQSQTEGLEKLYQLFHVEPVEAFTAHDGISAIRVPEQDKNNAFRWLWNHLVPPSGKARTAQGEAIRIAGKIEYELVVNGGMNWDGDFRKMLQIFPKYLHLGSPLSEEDLAEAKKITRLLKDGQDDGTLSVQLCAYAVVWVLKNPEPLPLLPADYRR